MVTPLSLVAILLQPQRISGSALRMPSRLIAWSRCVWHGASLVRLGRPQSYAIEGVVCHMQGEICLQLFSYMR